MYSTGARHPAYTWNWKLVGKRTKGVFLAQLFSGVQGPQSSASRNVLLRSLLLMLNRLGRLLPPKRLIWSVYIGDTMAMATPGICLDLQEQGHHLPNLMRHHSAVRNFLVLPLGYVAAWYTSSPLKAQLMGHISFWGPAVTHPPGCWWHGCYNSRKGKILQNSKGCGKQQKSGQRMSRFPKKKTRHVTGKEQKSHK